MEDTRKKIAAMTAVLQFLEAEKAAEPVLSEGRMPPSASEGFWTFSGRQSQMMLRSMAQMRLLPGWKG